MRPNPTALYSEIYMAAEGTTCGDYFEDQPPYRTKLSVVKDLDLFTIQKDSRVNLGGMPRVRLDGAFHDVDGDQDLRITEPELYADETSTIFVLPGCSENTRISSAKFLHDNVAALNPGSRVVSVANDGIGEYGFDMSVEQAFKRGFPEMAAARLRMAQLISEDRPVRLVTESMGAVIGTYLLEENLDANNEQTFVDIESVVNHSPATVTPDRAAKTMLSRFLPHLFFDTVKESLGHPLDALECAQPRFDLLRRSAMNAVGGQVFHILEGTNYALMDRVADSYHEGFLPHEHDVLTQRYMLDQLQADHPDTVRVQYGSGGHANIRTRKAAEDIQDMFAQLDELPARR